MTRKCRKTCGLNFLASSLKEVSLKPVFLFIPLFGTLEFFLYPGWKVELSFKSGLRGQPRWLRGLAPPSAQGTILETRDWVPRRAPCMEPASPSAYVSASLSLWVSALGSEHDPRVPGSSPTLGSLQGACFSSLCLCLCLSLCVSHE